MNETISIAIIFFILGTIAGTIIALTIAKRRETRIERQAWSSARRFHELQAKQSQ